MLDEISRLRFSLFAETLPVKHLKSHSDLLSRQLDIN